ncbi:MAG: alpha/beta fold hydrolase [Rubrobacteraceae bacterium]
MDWNHGYVEANGIRIHYVRHGVGMPLILLHGWPEFWYVYHKNIPALSENFDVIVPDLRGFGDTEKPGLPDPPEALLDLMSEDLRALVDTLGISRFGVVSHDVGSFIAQSFARAHPERLTGLFFFHCVYPGIGRRWLEPDSVKEIWYQSFNQKPWAADIVGMNRDSCRTYIKHFLDHWAAEPGLFDDDIEMWVDNFMKPGNLQGGFDWYVGINEARTKMWRHGAPEMARIEVPTRFFWGAKDPLIKIEWADRLGEYFSDFSLEPAPEAGHFVHYETPEAANREISDFFSGNLSTSSGV